MFNRTNSDQKSQLSNFKQNLIEDYFSRTKV